MATREYVGGTCGMGESNDDRSVTGQLITGLQTVKAAECSALGIPPNSEFAPRKADVGS